MTRVWLIRHGEPVAEARHRCYGSLDVGLSTKGQEQMHRVAEYLRSEPISRIYSSPRTRAQQGARTLSLSVSQSIEIIQDFREIDFGNFEGLSYAEIAVRHPDLYRNWMEKPTEVQFPDGESFTAMQTRVIEAFKVVQNRHEGETIAVVSHAGVNRILLAEALEIPHKCIFRLGQDYAAMNLLAFTNGFPVVQLLNSQA